MQRYHMESLKRLLNYYYNIVFVSLNIFYLRLFEVWYNKITLGISGAASKKIFGPALKRLSPFPLRGGGWGWGHPPPGKF